MAAQVSIGTLDGNNLQTAVINSAAGGDITVVSAVTGQIVRVYKLVLNSITATAITPKDGASTALSGPLEFGATDTRHWPNDGQPWYKTSSGNAFIINSSAAVQVSGTCYFTQQSGTQS